MHAARWRADLCRVGNALKLFLDLRQQVLAAAQLESAPQNITQIRGTQAGDTGARVDAMLPAADSDQDVSVVYMITPAPNMKGGRPRAPAPAYILTPHEQGERKQRGPPPPIP